MGVDGRCGFARPVHSLGCCKLCELEPGPASHKRFNECPESLRSIIPGRIHQEADLFPTGSARLRINGTKKNLESQPRHVGNTKFV
jgi:hypothetical protein